MFSSSCSVLVKLHLSWREVIRKHAVARALPPPFFRWANPLIMWLWAFSLSRSCLRYCWSLTPEIIVTALSRHSSYRFKSDVAQTQHFREKWLLFLLQWCPTGILKSGPPVFVSSVTVLVVTAKVFLIYYWAFKTFLKFWVDPRIGHLDSYKFWLGFSFCNNRFWALNSQ